MRKVFGIGDTVLDIIFKDGKPVAAVPGGSIFNTMISLGRTTDDECDIVMVSKSGKDKVGDVIVNFMAENGVDSELFGRKEGVNSNVSLAFLDENNDAEYQFYKNAEPLSASDADPLTFHKEDILIAGSYFAASPAIRPYTLSVIRKSVDAGAIFYYDVNFRKNNLKEIDTLLPSVLENIAMCDIVRGSSEDFGYLFEDSDPESVYNTRIKDLCDIMICTSGSEPVHIFTPDDHYVFPVNKIETVSTIGAGDNFNAGIIYSLLEYGIKKEHLADISDSLWSKIVSIAMQFSGCVCQSIFNYVDKDFKPQL